MLFTPKSSAVMARCQEAFQQPARPAEPQTQAAPAKMNAMDRMYKHRELAKRPAVRSGAASMRIDPGGTMRGCSAYDQAKRVRAQRLARFGQIQGTIGERVEVEEEASDDQAG